MANAKTLNEFVNKLVLRVRGIIKLLPEVVILKINVRDARRILNQFGIRFAISLAASSKLLELHNVLGECTSLVTENVRNHAQFFVQIG